MAFRVIAFPFLFFMVAFREGTAFADALIVLRRIAADHLRLFHGDAEMLFDKIDGGEDRQKGIPLAAARAADIGDGGQLFRGGAAGDPYRRLRRGSVRRGFVPFSVSRSADADAGYRPETKLLPAGITACPEEERRGEKKGTDAERVCPSVLVWGSVRGVQRGAVK